MELVLIYKEMFLVFHFLSEIYSDFIGHIISIVSREDQLLERGAMCKRSSKKGNLEITGLCKLFLEFGFFKGVCT